MICISNFIFRYQSNIAPEASGLSCLFSVAGRALPVLQVAAQSHRNWCSYIPPASIVCQKFVEHSRQTLKLFRVALMGYKVGD
jgi:hypothetical protein